MHKYVIYVCTMHIAYYITRVREWKTWKYTSEALVIRFGNWIWNWLLKKIRYENWSVPTDSSCTTPESESLLEQSESIFSLIIELHAFVQSAMHYYYFIKNSTHPIECNMMRLLESQLFTKKRMRTLVYTNFMRWYEVLTSFLLRVSRKAQKAHIGE